MVEGCVLCAFRRLSNGGEIAVLQSGRRWMIPDRSRSSLPPTYLSLSLSLSLPYTIYLSLKFLRLQFSIFSTGTRARMRVYIYKFHPRACYVTVIKFAYHSKTRIYTALHASRGREKTNVDLKLRLCLFRYNIMMV